MAKVITGAYGFIGSCWVSHLNQKGEEDLILVDDFSKVQKEQNLKGKNYLKRWDRGAFLHELETLKDVEIIYHLGARTDTTEMDMSIHQELNFNYSKALWNYAVKNNVPFIYASSAATYGDGALGFDDQILAKDLKPLNPYGESKNNFDAWVQNQEDCPPHWVGLKFFNVYGPNEFHKGRMASVVFHAFRQIKETGELRLFKSHNPEYEDGEQARDFVYVKDLINLLAFWSQKEKTSGIYNLGSGKAHTFNSLAEAIFEAMGLPSQITYIPTPEDIRDKYQYFTEAKMDRTRKAGYTDPFYSLKAGVQDYVKNYLIENTYL